MCGHDRFGGELLKLVSCVLKTGCATRLAFFAPALHLLLFCALYAKLTHILIVTCRCLGEFVTFVEHYPNGHPCKPYCQEHHYNPDKLQYFHLNVFQCSKSSKPLFMRKGFLAACCMRLLIIIHLNWWRGGACYRLLVVYFLIVPLSPEIFLGYFVPAHHQLV